MGGAVTRIGHTVRKASSPWTPTVHRVLRHARAQGVTWVPRVFDSDSNGRQVVEYIDGDVAHGDPAFIREDAVLTEVARAARQWHDATASFPRSDADVWFSQAGRKPHEVIAHNDFAPYNHVFRDGHWVGAIDFDICYPAPRLWDLAWTAYRYVPLTPGADAVVDDGPGADRSPFDVVETMARLGRFLEAYGPLEQPGEAGLARAYRVAELLSWVPERLHSIADWGAQQGSAEHQQWARMYRAHAQWITGGGLAGDAR
jgi:hypothetical protein